MGPRAGGYAVGKVRGSGIGNRIWIRIGIDGGILAGGRAGRKEVGWQARRSHSRGVVPKRIGRVITITQNASAYLQNVFYDDEIENMMGEA